MEHAIAPCPEVDMRIPSIAALLAGLLACLAANAADPSTVERMAEAMRAVVSIKTHAAPNARSAATLGTERTGSGVLISGDGLVLTIGYLVLEAERIEVTTAAGRTVPASLVAYDHATGFGLVRPLAPLDAKPIRLGDSKDVEVLDRVITAAGGGVDALEAATVVSKRRFAGYWEYLVEDAIFTSPPRIDHSGAALIDREGRLVGIGSLLVMDAAHPGERLPGNMFVPIDLLKPVLDEMVATGRQHGGRRPWIGLNSMEERGHLVVIRVSDGGPAEMAGIEPGDIILALAGRKIDDLADFYRRLWSSGEPGVEVTLRVLKGAEVVDVKIRSIDRADTILRKPTI
jgi:S1-C subfamily serine protease